MRDMVYLSASLGGNSRAESLKRAAAIDWFDCSAAVGAHCIVGDLLHFDPRRALDAEENADNLVRLAQVYSQIVQAWGGPVRIVTGFCPEPYSRLLGRPANCLHARAMALDLVPLDSDCDHFHRWLTKRWSGGLVRHPGSIHLDLRNKGRFSVKANLRPTVTWLTS